VRTSSLHGNGANLSNWTPILVGIVRHGYSPSTFDYRGYGLSAGQPSGAACTDVEQL
jgi:pimeloyl-ACP methyl ester carboxylesterase